MKKLFVITLVLTTTLCSCTSVNEAMNATVDPGVVSKDSLVLLPIVPRDYSKLEVLPIPDTLAMKQYGSQEIYFGYKKKFKLEQRGNATINPKDFDDAFKTRYVTLGKIPGDQIKAIIDIQMDNDRFFITYWNGDSVRTPLNDGEKFNIMYKKYYASLRLHDLDLKPDKSVHTLGPGLFNPHYAIFDKNGKCVAKVDNGDNYGEPTLNTTQKEFCILVKNRNTSSSTGHRIDVYDYKGNYLRTDFLQIDVNHLWFVDGKRIAANGYDLLLFDEEGKAKSYIVKDSCIYALRSNNALYFETLKQDTIWQATPTRLLARYVERKLANTPYLSRTSVEEHQLLSSAIGGGFPLFYGYKIYNSWMPRLCIGSWSYCPKQIAFKTSEFTNTGLSWADTIISKDNVAWKEYFTVAYYDLQEKQWYSITKKKKNFNQILMHGDNPQDQEKNLPNALIKWYTPLQLKYAFSNNHDLENNKEDKADEKFIKKLRLDANPVLIVTELK